MQSYQSGVAATVPVSLTDPATGSLLVAATARWRLLDAQDVVLIDWTAVADPAGLTDAFSAPIPAPQMTLAESEGHLSGRAIHLELTDDEGDVALLFGHFLITQNAADWLIPGTNSFQTYTQALIVASQIPNANLGPLKDAATTALIEAWRRIAGIKFRALRSIDLKSISADDWVRLPFDMRVSLCRAQVVEAQAILEGDEIAEARSRGVISMTVGESSQFFGSSKPLDMGVSPRALKEIGRWVDYSIRTTRA